jgi:dTDP-4-amino-4,6-dideoxygalactose transaminase
MKTYPLFKVHVPVSSTLAELATVLASGYINEGMQVTQLTQWLSQRMGTDKLCLTNSCTSALTVALKLAGVGPGDEVISTPMTCVATNTPIVNLGANIVWADVDPDTGMLDPGLVAHRITSKTKAVMAVAWAGAPPDLVGLDLVCRNRGIPLILDAAHAFDATYQNLQIHRCAQFTCYSFQAIKHFTTGDGGALVCLADRDHQRAKAMKWFGLDRDTAKDARGDWKGQQWDADIVEAGYKFNMNNVAAAIGLSQLPHIDRLIATHRANAALYDDLFRDFTPVRPTRKYCDTTTSAWVYTVLVAPDAKLSRDELLYTLNAEGIHAGVVHVPNDTYTCFAKYQADLPGVRQFSSHQLSLPCGWWLDGDDVRHIAQRVKELTT